MLLCGGVLFELDREGRLHRDVLLQLERNERAEALRGPLTELGHAARLAAVSGTPESTATVERLAGEIEAGLRDAGGLSAEIVDAARLGVLNARSVAAARGARDPDAAEAPAREAERESQRAARLLDRDIEAHAARINRNTAAQLRLGSALRVSVVVALVGLLALLAVVYAMYRAARVRERAARARIEELARFDALTRLPNRPSIVERLDHEIVRARRGGGCFAVLLFDLDGFKRVNDTWGHPAGDAALVMAAERVRSVMRASDAVGRLGGDEFLAILPDTGDDGAVEVARKLGEVLARPYGLGEAQADMSASIGIAVFPRDGADAEALQRAADAALYGAKRAGRNRWTMAARAAAVEGA